MVIIVGMVKRGIPGGETPTPRIKAIGKAMETIGMQTIVKAKGIPRVRGIRHDQDPTWIT
jgi:hypothetical protein